MDKKTIVVSVLLFLLIGLLFVKLWKTSSNLARSDIPMVNDAWYDALKAIEKDSENNPGEPWEKAIITSWWDFGHHFKYLSNRAVTFDGGTQVTPQAHWVGKLFLSSDEDISVRILRMLDCGGNKAFEKLDITWDAPESINILNTYFRTGTPTAGDGYAIDPASQYLNCTPPASYIIVSEDMIGKAGVWGHFGSWDFNRADMWINVKKMTKENGMKYILEKRYAEDEAQAEQLWLQLQTMTESEANNWIAPWPGYAGLNDCVPSDCTFGFNTTGLPQDEVNLVVNGRVNFEKCLQCNNGVNLITEDVILPNGQKPQSFVFIKDGQIIEKKYQDSTSGYSVVLTPDNKLVTVSPELANSLFTKLFFMNATGLKNFELLTKTQGIDGFKIYVYKVKSTTPH